MLAIIGAIELLGLHLAASGADARRAVRSQ
jgi:hypothetical protein